MFDSVRKLGDAIYVTTMAGIGDTCYIRPFIKILARDYDVYIKTVLPKMYSDITGVKFIRDEKETFRTQQKSRLRAYIIFHHTWYYTIYGKIWV